MNAQHFSKVKIKYVTHIITACTTDNNNSCSDSQFFSVKPSNETRTSTNPIAATMYLKGEQIQD